MADWAYCPVEYLSKRTACCGKALDLATEGGSTFAFCAAVAQW